MQAYAAQNPPPYHRRNERVIGQNGADPREGDDPTGTSGAADAPGDRADAADIHADFCFETGHKPRLKVDLSQLRHLPDDDETLEGWHAESSR